MQSQFTREPRTKSNTERPLWRRVFERATLQGPAYRTRRLAARATFFGLLTASAIFGALCGLMLVYSIDLPQMEDLARYHPNTTTELYDIHGKVFGSFALERRVVVPYEEFPPILREAILSIEDKSFERNWGVNLIRAVGAAWRDLHSSGKAQGASTLTMQLARNLFLSSQKTYGRKFQEVFLTVQIERRFTKQQIFSLYANQIYLGRGTYGFEAGAEYYFSKHAKDLTLPEAALMAALPKGPEYYSPVRFPERALRRRNLVLTEMQDDHKITAAQAAAAKAAPLGLRIESPPNSEAPYFVEEVRRQLEKEYGVEEVHGSGLKVYTTLDLDLQIVANRAVMDGVATYERRHGWKGHVPNIVLEGLDLESYRHPDWVQPLDKGDYFHALVLRAEPKRVVLKVASQQVVLGPADWKWTGFPDGDSFLKSGDVVYVKIESSGADGLKLSLQQDSGAQASMMAVDNANGEVLAMVGGRDFALSQFNRATQAQRQVGSSFKPYVYATAVEAGSKPTDHIVDGPVTFPTPNGPYTPHNYEPDYKGTMTLLDAFKESRNIPALKLANQVGIRKVIEMAHRFGITSNIPAFLPIALGAADITLYEQVGAYSTFPNDGIRIESHYIRKVTQADGMQLPAEAPEVTEVVSVETARTMMQFLQEVVRSGTGASAGAQLKHPLGGKTGTTNDFTDAWFIGFSPSVTCGTWIGFDNRETLGAKETGAHAALPMWIEFMRAAIASRPANEAFAAAGEPKKVLDVPLTPAVKKVPEPAKEDVDPDAPAGGEAPAKAAPENGGTAAPPSAAPAGAAPISTAPAKPAEAKRQVDTN